MKKRGVVSERNKNKFFVTLNFESLVFLAIITFTVVIIFAPDYESKQLYTEVIDTLFKGFLGYIARIAYEKLSPSRSTLSSDIPENNWIESEEISYNREELLNQKQLLENELNQINNRL
jgi:predicted aspartyl protease